MQSPAGFAPEPVPVFETTTLEITGGVLRAWTPADAPVLVDAWSDASISAWNPVPPEPDLATARRWIAGAATRETKRVSMDWVIDVAPLGGVVGEVGLSGFSPEHSGAMIGYWLLAKGKGQGLATAAVRAVTCHAHRQLGLETIVARCHPDNPASGAVVARVGYGKERLDSTGHELWMSRTRGA